ncbi:MAG: hypothetical protein ABSD85_05660 [Acidimicrobiales bacterium]|jgi:hypothetical protein
MTILAAVRVNETVLIGADSLEIRQQAGYGETVDKLYRVPGTSVIWGYYGNGDAGKLFRKHVVETPVRSWGDLTYKFECAVEKLDSDYVLQGGFGALFAGDLHGELRIAGFGSHHRASDEWCFLGLNRLAAQVSWEILATRPNGLNTTERFRLVMETVIQASQSLLGMPLNCWRITTSTCEPCNGTDA